MKKYNKFERRVFVSILLINMAVVFMLSACQVLNPAVQSTPTARPTITPEPIVPTRTPIPTVISTSVVISEGSATSTVVTVDLDPGVPQTATPTADQNQDSDTEQTVQETTGYSQIERFGVTDGLDSGGGNAGRAREAGLPFRSLLNWNVNPSPPLDDIIFWQMIRIYEGGIRKITWEELELVIQANPGSYWIVGNEPDVRWQDNVTPQRYAEIYHDVYSFIKERDPEAKLVIGGVTQPTPLRRAYLDIVLDTYEGKYGQMMPIDVWNVHTFILREERGSWGVDIPPGMDDSLAIPYEIEDHDDLEIIEQNLTDFRSWMADRGYGDKPLIISEYGILMPEDYGFPPEKVADFLTGSFELFQTLSGETGYQPDGGRLVQQWFWYIIYDGEIYPTGNLFDPSSGQLTALGEVWKDHVSSFLSENKEQP